MTETEEVEGYLFTAPITSGKRGLLPVRSCTTLFLVLGAIVGYAVGGILAYHWFSDSIMLSLYTSSEAVFRVFLLWKLLASAGMGVGLLSSAGIVYFVGKITDYCREETQAFYSAGM